MIKVNISINRIEELIKAGEGISTEFKTCRKSISRNVYETVAAFLNRKGGSILLGVTDSGKIQGIDKDAIQQKKKGFCYCCK